MMAKWNVRTLCVMVEVLSYQVTCGGVTRGGRNGSKWYVNPQLEHYICHGTSTLTFKEDGTTNKQELRRQSIKSKP